MTYSRRFPNLAWAWPQGGRNQLVVAAICPDEARAFAAIESWLHETDLDDATFAEHRLLAAITTRFDDRLKKHKEYARLNGLQRLNWTRSLMAMSAAKPALQEMVSAGLRLILLKGACRVALDVSEQKSRTAYDLDLLLSPSDFVGAFEILAANGWVSTRGESVLGLRGRISSVRARNFKHGRFGDIDLHQSAYHIANQSENIDRALLDDVQPAQFYGLPVFVPSPEERLAMAIGHGGWDGHSHSDWLVDAARIVNVDGVDWDKFCKIIKCRKLSGPTAIALSYLSTEVGLNISSEVLREVCGRTNLASPAQISAMFLAKDTGKLTSAQRTIRRAFENFHKLKHSGRDKMQDTPLFRAVTKPGSSAAATAGVLEQQLVPDTQAKAGLWSFNVTLNVKAPPKRRRIEFEINSPTRNLCHLQAFHLRKSGDHTMMRFKGQIELKKDDFPCVLSALPGKLVEAPDGSAEHQKYGIVPFSVLAADFTHQS
ncbi:nucleotidyltransferase family protein [Yoonia algicola]|uniref:Nucleotidyltransferase family protein n=1 Tax=Yoonia algicola TaxID=3137368 RepID=A0AAN0MC31_9RHOB